jgi:hypothetical protein
MSTLLGLANSKTLSLFDYLSTVSSGAYVGGWLSALQYRKNGGAPVGEAEVRNAAVMQMLLVSLLVSLLVAVLGAHYRKLV